MFIKFHISDSYFILFFYFFKTIMLLILIYWLFVSFIFSLSLFFQHIRNKSMFHLSLTCPTQSSLNLTENPFNGLNILFSLYQHKLLRKRMTISIFGATQQPTNNASLECISILCFVLSFFYFMSSFFYFISSKVLVLPFYFYICNFDIFVFILMHSELKYII